ncbi:MAG: hypothetical protein IPN26_17670 [Bacteroidetes bacterium]|nr:hypothetical protein [Bacteroidota bacterium]
MTSKIKNLFQAVLFLAAIGGMTLFNGCAEEHRKQYKNQLQQLHQLLLKPPAPAPAEAAPAPAAADAAPAKTDSMDAAETKPTEPSVKQR